MQPEGKYRVKNPEGRENGVWVDDKGIGFEMPESVYVEGNHQPSINSLPWGKPQSVTDGSRAS